MFKKLFFVCVFIITGMSGYGALAQSNAPDPTPGVEAVAPITITSDKSGICAGGIDSEPHRSVITASLSPTNNADIAGKSIRFTLENSDPDYPAYIKDASSDGSKTVSTDNDGNASIILISSHLIGSTTTVKAIYGEAEKETFVSTVDAEGDMTVDADELVADGQSTANVYLALTYNGEPVNGHNINFHILSVVDANGTPVAPSSDGSFPGYGSVAAVQGTTDDAGIAYATYTAGTLPGTITFESDDNSALIAENMTAGSFSVSSSSPRIVQVKPRKRQKPLGSAGTKRPVVTVSVNFFYVYKGTVRPTTSLTPQSTITKLNSVWLPQAQVKFKAKSTTQYQQALPWSSPLEVES